MLNDWNSVISTLTQSLYIILKTLDIILLDIDLRKMTYSRLHSCWAGMKSQIYGYSNPCILSVREREKEGWGEEVGRDGRKEQDKFLSFSFTLEARTVVSA